MTPHEIVAEWMRGCRVAERPWRCEACTVAAANALRKQGENSLADSLLDVMNRNPDSLNAYFNREPGKSVGKHLFQLGRETVTFEYPDDTR
ncbi:hypothetical protein ACGYU5_15255 [Burkholderia pseudomallei]